MVDTEDLADVLTRNLEVLERILETTQNMFIQQALEAGISVHQVKALVGVSTDRVTRISKLRPKASLKRDN